MKLKFLTLYLAINLIINQVNSQTNDRCENLCKTNYNKCPGVLTCSVARCKDNGVCLDYSIYCRNSNNVVQNTFNIKQDCNTGFNLKSSLLLLASALIFKFNF